MSDAFEEGQGRGRDIPERGLEVALWEEEAEVAVRRWGLVCSGVRLGWGRRGGPFGLTMLRRWCETKDLDLRFGCHNRGQIPTNNGKVLK